MCAERASEKEDERESARAHGLGVAARARSRRRRACTVSALPRVHLLRRIQPGAHLLQSLSSWATSSKRAAPLTMAARRPSSFASACALLSVIVACRHDDGRREPACFTRMCDARTERGSAAAAVVVGRSHTLSCVARLK